MQCNGICENSDNSEIKVNQLLIGSDEKPGKAC